MFRARLRARLCRGKEGLHRAPTCVRQFGGYTHILLLFLSSTHYCPLFHPLLSEISSSSCKDLARGSAGSKTPGVVTICGWSAAERRPTPGLQQWLTFEAASNVKEWSKVGIFRTKVDEKVDNSGWRIKIKNSSRMWVYPPNCRTKVGARWSPSFPRQSLARRRARNIVQVHAHALNGSWECYNVVRIGLGAIWGDHGRRRSLHFTTPHYVWKRGGYTHFVHFPIINVNFVRGTYCILVLVRIVIVVIRSSSKYVW